MTTDQIIRTANRIAPFVDKWSDGVESISLSYRGTTYIHVTIATFRAAFAGREVVRESMGGQTRYSIALDDIDCRVDAYGESEPAVRTETVRL